MARHFPYALISCPCDPQDDFAASTIHTRQFTSGQGPEADDGDDVDEPLNPHSPGLSFSLFPYDRLLYCDECHQIRCPKCWAEEITNWYCPSCLFEVPSSVVKNDGNRCTRNCYNCPICTAPLSINALDRQSSTTDSGGAAGPFFLSCPYCEWSSLEVGIELDKPSKITEQLVRRRKATRADAQTDARTLSPDSADVVGASEILTQASSPESRFAQLASFYKTQLSESDAAASNPFGLDSSYSSPSNLARIMQIYGGLSATSLKRAKEKPRPMREALSSSEGLNTFSPSDGLHVDATNAEAAVSSISQTATFEQRASHPWNHEAALATELWPVPAHLRTKTSKRCRACRHILIRHDDSRSKTSSSSSAITSGKYKIRLLAQNRIPRLSLRPFNATAVTSAAAAFPSPAFALTSTALQTLKETEGGMGTLRPLQTKSFLLIVTNPLFETVRVTLASPQTTPGRVGSRVTILCPTFEIGPDGDMWDSALDGAGSTPVSAAGGSRSRAEGAAARGLAGGSGQWRGRTAGAAAAAATDDAGASSEGIQPEAGKVWERGRNWVAVVVEVVPGSLPPASSTQPSSNEQIKHGGAGAEDAKVERGDDAAETYDEWVQRKKEEGRERSVRDDVLEIPVFVKAEWEADAPAEDTSASAAGGGASGKTVKAKRELGFWCVLGAGRIVP